MEGADTITSDNEPTITNKSRTKKTGRGKGLHNISEFTKGRIVGMMESGLSGAEAGRRLGLSDRTVLRWWKHYQQNGHCHTSKSPGRPRKISEQDEHRLLELVQKQPFASSSQLQRELGVVGVAERTMRRRCAEAKLSSLKGGDVLMPKPK